MSSSDRSIEIKKKRREVSGKRVCKPDSVRRKVRDPDQVDRDANFARGDHSSGPDIAAGIKRPTRGSGEFAREQTLYGPGQPSPPIWPCTTRGFPCPECHHPGGGLLPHLFTLTRAVRPKEAGSRLFLKPAAEARPSPAVYFLWHFPWLNPHGPSPLALPGALPSNPRP